MASLFDYPVGEAEALEELHCLHHGTDDDLAAIISHTHRRRYKAGQTVIAEGATDRALYIVIHGVVERVVPSRKGFRQLSTSESGAVINELSFFDGRPRTTLVRALTDAEMARLSPESFDALATSRPALGRMLLLDLARTLATRLRGADGTQ